ncbi:MerR family transcriptional regulator [Breznakiella homolactica]|uniref:MerR family transcriptional regulator n=1 Tax=Breznakiella homolactica TaxID=2798577 RepID=A0A7T7XMC0_9SPIR|nr:MerR family transcriptional regulator [Breznakiella homolactica]QQO08857.1 MerR family transcriptional regulator [Breznakiella homolactica]
MYRIGQFSKIARVTVKALRFYEEEGLIAPVFIDPVTGYRYYDSSQLPVTHRIVALKQCGFSVAEIKGILDGKDSAELFRRRREALERQAVETAVQLSSINHYLDLFEKDEPRQYEIVVKELPRVLVFSKRMQVPSYDSYFTVVPEIGRIIRDLNPGIRCCEDPPYCFIIYHDGEYRERDINIEFCQAVEARGRGTAEIVFKTVDRVPQAACVLHRGPYETLPRAYAAVYDWIGDNDYEPADHPRESHIDGIWNRSSPEEWLTEIQVPVTLNPRRTSV